MVQLRCDRSNRRSFVPFALLRDLRMTTANGVQSVLLPAHLRGELNQQGLSGHLQSLS